MASGAPDPGFGGGRPVEVTGFDDVRQLLVRDDGSVVLSGAPPVAPPDYVDRVLLARYSASGALDPGFGAGGVVDLGASVASGRMLPAAGGELLFASASSLCSSPARFSVLPVTANGRVDPQRCRVVEPAFGGGSAYVAQAPHLPGWLQNTFAGTLVRRADGSYLLAGAVSIAVPRGQTGRWAVAALTPAFESDPTFGGSATPLGVAVGMRSQRTRTVRRQRAIAVDLQTSAIGLARVKVTHGTRTIASTVTTVLSTDRTPVMVGLTSYGTTFLRRHRKLRVVVRATGRDLLANTTTTSARSRLR